MRVAVLLFLVVAMSAFAASPVASVSSSSDFVLRGVRVATAGVPSWPVLAGDNVLAGVAPARIRFQDGSVVTLAPDSSARVEQKDDSLLLRLTSGSMAFTLAPNSTIGFFSGQSALQATPNVEVTAMAARPAKPSAGSQGVTLGITTPPQPLSRK